MPPTDTVPHPTAPAPSIGRSAAFRLLVRSLCLAAGLAVLLAPALWNGFALIFHDTGGYVRAAMEMRLIPGRSLVYGLFLQATSLDWRTLWGPVLVQSAATLWLIHLLLRCHGLPAGPPALTLVGIGLAGLTGISWYSAQLMPDILVPLTVLALWLLAVHRSRLRRPEQAGLVGLALLGVLAHMSCLALGLGLTMVILAARLLTRQWPLRVWVTPPVAVMLAGLVLMPLLHFSLTGKAGYTPGGSIFLFGRLVQDGLVQRWLAEHCPAPNIHLCGLQHRLPATADEFLWTNESAFQDLGGWLGESEPELKRLTAAAVTAYPGMTAWTTLRSTAQQMIKVATGDALDEGHYDSRGYLLSHLFHLASSFTAARQQRDAISRALFDSLNLVHEPVALASLCALPLLAFRTMRRRRHDLAGLALFVLLALLGNAFICGALSNPHDRYQSRLVWLAPLVAGMAMTATWRPRCRRCSQTSL